MKSTGLNTAHIKASIRPQDDLYRHMNGAWIDSAEIPADRSSDGAFYRLYENAEKQVREIIEELGATEHPQGSIAQKIGDLYKSFMDQARANQLGISPIKADLDLALSISDRDSFHEILGDLERRGLGGLFYESVTGDKMDSKTNITYIGQSGLSLPDESYYREDEYQEIRDGLLEHIEKMFTIAGISGGAEKAKLILALETQIASHHWDQVRDRDAELTYNKMSYAELKAISDGFDWDRWMAASKTPEKVLAVSVVSEPSFFTGISEMLKKFDAPSWSAWLGWHALSGSASYLHDELVNENFRFYGTVLSGTPELKARWKRGVGLVEGSLGEAIGQIYVERHFPPQAKVRMEQLVANLIEAYRIDIAALDWMTDETKTKALEKLGKFRPKIGYPNKWRDYSALEIAADDLMGNIQRVTEFVQNYVLEKVGQPVDLDEWLMTPQTVNAYYHPIFNEIVFPAAILQPPFFDMEADDAANYGGIGAVIGHEIGHGFDDQGSKYDGDGNLNNWWSDADRTEFEKRANKLIAQYDQLRPEIAPDVHVNGALTIGENIGDLGGLTIAYKAYQLSLQGAPAPVIDGFTGSQRLFMGWAQVWRQKMRAEEVKRRVSTDPHSPDEFRCNQVVKNLVEFYEAFDVKEGDALYLPESERVRIW
ncbi:unannotated protein [freshwater metagenome]|uniref:Unannotated protein n=1 Tax=freshwater metagenome TaxID=449393 RepID=A0A6J6FRX7_9ZZZZ|nr:peptidase M13 [Actinomycetota bacterium]MSW15262.1 peptidase M13 [Actinomycetota bacterium]MSW98667.1 peptidase M13 [Actinomycetota bacterium]MTA04496.1 peptidase M13 [Actinomycetota bacterium]MTA22653.1 peptidase M13 [Actinomycetota bacterium]